MKKMMFVLVGLLFVVQSHAQDVYRPYLSCHSTNQKTKIEIFQNTNHSKITKAYSFSVQRNIEDSKISINNQNAVIVPIKRKDILEFFDSFGNKPSYRFSLIVTIQEKDIGFKSYFNDNYGRSVVYCNHHVTFNN